MKYGLARLIILSLQGALIGALSVYAQPDTLWTRGVVSAGEIRSVIRTDDWDGYNRLESLGYVRDVVKKQSNQQKNLLPSCHTVASLRKRWLMGTHQGAVSHEHLDYYLDEFTFRFNRRKSSHRGMLFYRLLRNAVKVDPVTYKRMTKNIRGRKPQNHNI